MKIRATRPELCPADHGGHTNTQNRDGHYLNVGGPHSDGESVEQCVERLLRNEFHQGEFFQPGECVDVEEHFGEYIGRFRINHSGELVQLPPTPTRTSGCPDRKEAAMIQLQAALKEATDSGLFDTIQGQMAFPNTINEFCDGVSAANV
jgi:hypothetical protein